MTGNKIIITNPSASTANTVISEKKIIAPNLQQLLQPGQSKIIISQATSQSQPQKMVLNQANLSQVAGKQIIIKQPQVQQKLILNQAGKVIQPVQQQQQIVIGGQRILLNPGQQIITQTIQTPEKPPIVTQNVIQQPQQQNTPQKVTILPAQVQQHTVTSPLQDTITSPQTQQRTQIVVQNPTLAQQISSGKVQMATINGQQVLIRQVGNNQAVVVAHIKQQGDSPAQVVPVQTQTGISSVQPASSNVTQSAAKVIVQQPQQSPVQRKTIITQPTVNQQSSADLSPIMEAALLKGQPQGTVIKCVTAQVIQTQQGPRIVLQGLQGSDFTQQQSALVQQQVKQQLLKGTHFKLLLRTSLTF